MFTYDGLYRNNVYRGFAQARFRATCLSSVLGVSPNMAEPASANGEGLAATSEGSSQVVGASMRMCCCSSGTVSVAVMPMIILSHGSDV